MFAEELGGNASKRRQEEARNRRRQLKQQEDQKKKAEERVRQQQAIATERAASSISSTSLGAVTPADAVVATAATAATIRTTTVGLTTLTSSTSSSSSTTATTAVTTVLEKSSIPIISQENQNTAVQNALQLRQQRQAIQNQIKAATTIQSFLRMCLSNIALVKHHTILLGQRLRDLKTLTTMLAKVEQQRQSPNHHQQQQPPQQTYIPPTATSTALLLQILFLTRSIPYSGKHRKKERSIQIRRDQYTPLSRMLQQLLNLALLHGIYSNDENSNPFLLWVQTHGGRQRIEDLIRLTWVILVNPPNMDDAFVTEAQTSYLEFLRAIQGKRSERGTPPTAVVAFGRKLLWSSIPLDLPSKHPPDTSVICLRSSSLDLLSLLRFHLLYNMGSPDPIPKMADRIREKCIPDRAKRLGDHLMRIVIDGIDRDKELQVRFVCEILTIPLLSWKTMDVLQELLARPFDNSSTSKPRLIVFLESLIMSRSEEYLDTGKIGHILRNDVSLTVCPATPTQILLANLVHIGRLCPALSGTQPSQLNFEASTLFYQLLATLVDDVPLATFSSRESSVEWISDGKGHHSPVVLSSVIIEQCKSLLVDSFVRKLLDCAIDTDELRTEVILQQKNEKDIKQETALRESGGNAASLAAQEAKINRSKGFFQSAVWAQRIKGGMSKLMAKDDSAANKNKAESQLIDASAVSRKLAQGEIVPRSNLPEKIVRNGYSISLLKALCRLYGIILARWGGDGGRDCVRSGAPSLRREVNGGRQEVASSSAEQCTQALLNNFVFSTDILKACWGLIQSDAAVVADVYAIIDPHKGQAPVRSLSILPQYSSSNKDTKYKTRNDGFAMLFVFVSALSRILIVTDDSEIHDMGSPMPLHQLRRCIQTLKQLLYRACCLDNTSQVSQTGEEVVFSTYQSNYFGLAMISASARTMRDLYDRSSRRPLAVPKLWLIDDLMEKEIRRCKSKEDYVLLLATPVLRVCPFLVSFKRRLKLFEQIVTSDRIAIQGENSPNPFHTNPLKPGIPIRITRGRILEDGLATMNHLGRNMRQRLAVQYYNEAGVRESGIDVGGLFKEFWTDLCAIAFDPNYALFRVTEGTYR